MKHPFPSIWCGVLVGLLAMSCSKGTPGGPSGANLAVTAVVPPLGSTTGGQAITISGQNFTAGATVSIGGTAATAVQVVSPTSITAVAAPRAAGSFDVVVTAGGRTASLPQAFTYVAPPPNVNQLPVIQTLLALGTRANQPAAFADLNEIINVTAIVTDAETNPSVLTYEWSAPQGTFSGAGESVTWRAPQTFTTPGTLVLTLVVVDRYSAPAPNGLPVQHEQRVTRSVTVRVHNSAKEVADLTTNFLELFSNSSMPAETVVQGFMSGCGVNGMGKQNELNDVANNRANFTITSHTLGTPQVSINFGGVCPFRSRSGDACSATTVDWRDVSKSTGLPGRSFGIDHVTAAYDGTRWWLCDSDFESLGTTTIRAHGQRFKP